MIEMELTGDDIVQILNQLRSSGQDLTPAPKDIGEELIGSTKDRFNDEKAPDGSGWATLSDVTIDNKGHDNKLAGESGQLAKQFSYEASSSELVVANLQPYAAMQHFGGKKSDFPHLWGDIPARPFMGISSSDRDEIFAILTD